MSCARVQDECDDEIVEIELEDDNTMLISTLRSVFPDATGLKCRMYDSNVPRICKVHDDRIYSPNDGQGWNDRDFVVVHPRDPSKSGSRPQYKEKRDNGDDQRFSKRTGFRKTNLDKSPGDPMSVDPCDLLVTNVKDDITEDVLRNQFEQYGVLELIDIKKSQSGESRGFAFIRFRDITSQRECQRNEIHRTNGRTLFVKRRSDKLSEQLFRQCENRIFVGKMSDKMDENKLTKYFETFGDVKNVIFPKVFRGFCFVTFMNINAVYEVMDVGNCHLVGAEKLSVAVAREDLKKGGELGYIPTEEFYKPVRRSKTPPPLSRRRQQPNYYPIQSSYNGRRRVSRSPVYHESRHRSSGVYYDERGPPRAEPHVRSRDHYRNSTISSRYGRYQSPRAPKYSPRLMGDHRENPYGNKYSFRGQPYLEHGRPSNYRPRD